MIIPIIAGLAIFMMMKKHQSTTSVKGAIPNKSVPTNVNTSAVQHTNQAQSQSTATQLETAAGGLAISYLAKQASAWAQSLSSSGSTTSATDPSTVNGDGTNESEFDETDLADAEFDMGADTADASGDTGSYDIYNSSDSGSMDA